VGGARSVGAPTGRSRSCRCLGCRVYRKKSADSESAGVDWVKQGVAWCHTHLHTDDTPMHTHTLTKHCPRGLGKIGCCLVSHTYKHRTHTHNTPASLLAPSPHDEPPCRCQRKVTHTYVTHTYVSCNTTHCYALECHIDTKRFR
jgi:hypothetical protein